MENMEFNKRLEGCYDELKWLYCELYHNDTEAFAYFINMLKEQYEARKQQLRDMDEARLKDQDWYRSNRLLGMMMYPANFGGTLRGMTEKIPYLSEFGVNYLHLMPLLDSPPEKSDGGYAVSDFRKIRPDLGTMDDLSDLADACHEKDMVLCLDFVLNHTSEEHAWAKAAREGDPVAKSRYFFFENWNIPNEYEKTVPQVFPTTAPGNFTQLENGDIVMTCFYPFQWDLNYANPMVFNDMTENLLYLANKGTDIIRLDAVPYIWKELGTSCRNLPQVHTLVRMMRLACSVVCPGVLLLGEVVMEPAKVVPYFGSVEKPECHMLYNVTTMATTWHTAATHDVSLLKKQLDIVGSLPHDYVFQNYLRCHDDIGWGLDYDTLKLEGISEPEHKQYLNDYFRGYTGGSWSRGELYNEDPITRDARFCATTASMCGVEAALEAGNEEELEKAIRFDETLHAYMFMQSGIPVLYSGDEIGQLNDYTYREDPNKAADSRFVHRGVFDWEKAERIQDESSVEGKIYSRLKRLGEIRRSEKVFVNNADMWTLDTGDTSVLGIGRYYEGEKLIGLFSFSPENKTVHLQEEGSFVNLLSGNNAETAEVQLPGYGFVYLKQTVTE